MIGRLACILRGRGRRVAPALEGRLAALERALGVKMEAQLVVLAQAVAEVVTSELARERRQLRLELALLRDRSGQGVGSGAGLGQRAGDSGRQPGGKGLAPGAGGDRQGLGGTAMSRLRGSLQELANPGSEFTWATFAFAGNDPLEAVLESGYFDWCSGRLRQGDLILWGCNPDRSGRRPMGEPTPIRRALLMVTAVTGSATTVRLVQDWGGVEE